MISGPVLDFDPGAVRRPKAGIVDTRDPPFAYDELALAVAALLIAAWLTWRYRHLLAHHTTSLIATGRKHWREFLLFTLLAAILARLW